MKSSVMNRTLNKGLRQIWRCRMIYLMMIPGIVAVFIFHYIPIYGVQIAFKDFRASKGILGSVWVGLKHFKKFVSYPYFKDIVVNTLRISLYSLANFPCAIIFALMLNEMKSNKLKKVCQQITYAPHFVSLVVTCSMVHIFASREGLFNMIGSFLGLEPTNVLSIPAAFPLIFSLSGLWQNLGWGTIIYIACLSGVSQELVEAAKIDGATRMKVIWHVNLPHLKPTIITMFILRLGSMMSVGFEKTFLLQNALNLETSSIISTYAYEMGIGNQQFSYSSAIDLFNNVVNILLIVTANAISKKITKEGLW